MHAHAAVEKTAHLTKTHRSPEPLKQIHPGEPSAVFASFMSTDKRQTEEQKMTGA